MHLISVRLSSLTIFLLFFFYVVLCSSSFYFSLYVALGWQERSKRKSCQERKSKIVLPSQRLWKSLPLNSDDSLRWNCGSRVFIELWCVIFGYLFIYLFEIMKQIVFIFCLPFLFFENTFLGNTFFLLCFQSIILTCGMCLINLDLKLIQ